MLSKYVSVLSKSALAQNEIVNSFINELSPIGPGNSIPLVAALNLSRLG